MRANTVVLAAVLLGGCQGMPSEGDSKAGVASAAAAWSEAFNKCDAAGIAQLYAPDAALWGTVSPAIISSPQGVRQYFDQACAMPTPPKVAFGEQLIRVHGDAATNSGSYTFTVMRAGKPAALPARYTFAYRKAGGQWLIVDHHSSLRPAPPK